MSKPSSTFTGSETAANLNSANANAVTVKAKWKSALPSFYTITYMQDMTSTVCNSVQTPSTSATTSVTKSNYASYGQSTSYVPETTLIDSRDSQTYVVRKLPDGNCWMVRNLNLSLTAGRSIVASTISGGTVTWTPSITTQSSGGAGQDLTSPYSFKNGNYVSDEDGVSQLTGVYYTWSAATATSGNGVSSGDATNSVCAKGWRLPPANGNKSFYNLFSLKFGSLSGNDISWSGVNKFHRRKPYSMIASDTWWASGSITTSRTDLYGSSANKTNAGVFLYDASGDKIYPRCGFDQGCQDNRYDAKPVRCVNI